MTSDQLRKLAALLRTKAVEVEKTSMEKCAQVTCAAKGLAILLKKVSHGR